MRLTKHHGLANDFLVAIDLDDRSAVTPALVRAVCDRHRGVGADGLIRATAEPGGAIRMHLFNADGGRAEISGNGIGCLAQALVMTGAAAGPTVEVLTDAGRRSIEIVPAGRDGSHRIRVDMGAAKVGDDETRWIEPGVVRAAAVDVGNPHVVLLHDAPPTPEIVEHRGQEINDLVPGGVNVEFIVARSDRELDMQVFERGAGVTLACGTGACAAAAATAGWDVTGPSVRVNMAGGSADIEVGETIVYSVPIEFVATVEVPWV
jgi:diaminopimelate epimerase